MQSFPIVTCGLAGTSPTETTEEPENDEYELREGVDYVVDYYKRGQRVSSLDAAANYELLICGINLLRGYYSSIRVEDPEDPEEPEGPDSPEGPGNSEESEGTEDPSETGESGEEGSPARYTEAFYPFAIYGEKDALPGLVNGLEDFSYDNIDQRYSDPSDKVEAVEDYITQVDEIDAGIGFLGAAQAEELLSAEVYSKALAAIEVANGFVDLRQCDPMAVFKDSNGEDVERQVLYMKSAVRDPEPVVKIYDIDAGDYTPLDSEAYALVYHNAADDSVVTPYPTEAGRFTVAVNGLGRYFGSASCGDIRVAAFSLYAGIDGDTLVLSSSPLEEDIAIWNDADELLWNEALGRYVPHWYGCSDLYGVRFEEGTYIPSLSNMFAGMDELIAIDFTNLTTGDGQDKGAFDDCPNLSQITFGNYRPSAESGLSGYFFNPNYDENDSSSKPWWDVAELAENLTDETLGPWIKREGVWTLDDTIPTDPSEDERDQVEVPSPNGYTYTYTYNGNEQVAFQSTDDYTVLMGGSGKDAGRYQALLKLNDPDKEWNDGWRGPRVITWYIAKQKVSIPKPSETDFFYTGKEQTLVADTRYYTVENGTKTDSGEYKAVVTLRDEENYAWSDGTTAPIAIAWKIYPEGEAIPVPIPVAVENLTYTGREQVGVETNELYSVEHGTATDVGNYTATVALKDTVHYAWSDGSIEPKTIEWSISKTAVNVPRAIPGLIYGSSGGCVGEIRLNGQVAIQELKL